MTYSINKKFKIDFAHRAWQRIGRGKGGEPLPYPYNKCCHIHGHTLFVWFTFSGERLDEQNFIMDTDLLMESLSKLLKDMDQALVLDVHDPLYEDFKKILAKEDLRLFTVDFSPSFEGLAEFFYKKAKGIISQSFYNNEIRIVEVKVGVTNIEAVYYE